MKICLAVSFLFFFVLLPRDGRAQWVADGVGICVQPSSQAGAVIVPDGLGGLILAWADNRNGNTDIYAQRVSASGASQWTANGVALCTAANAQTVPVIVADGAGGAIVAWQDSRGTNRDIYAQRIDASGTLQWTAGGAPLCSAANDQRSPVIDADGAGGAIVSWTDHRSGSNDDVYVQRVNATGSSQWTTDGVALCTALKDQWAYGVVSDGAGGAIVVWEHAEALGNYDVFARAINSAGVPQWAANGVAICTSPNEQSGPTVTSDGVAGAIITWWDRRSSTNYDVYAQRINPSGAVMWTAGGVLLCTDPDDQFSPVPAPDGAGGAVIAWDDWRPGATSDIYAQRIDASGLVQWPLAGVPLCTAADGQAYPSIAGDGAGGAIVAWNDFRTGTANDVYAQHVNSAGVVVWSPNGVPVSTAQSDQAATRIVSDGVGGVFVAWMDHRSGDYDVYAERLGADGAVPSGVRDTPSASAISLSPNYPNPFSSETAIDLDLRHGTAVGIEVFDAAGRRVRQIDVGRPGRGLTRLTFNGLDDKGRPLPSGVYFYRVKGAGHTFTRKMVIAR